MYNTIYLFQNNQNKYLCPTSNLNNTDLEIFMNNKALLSKKKIQK